MKYELFATLYDEAFECNLEHYISDRGWQEWMEQFSDSDNDSALFDSTKVCGILERIYALAHMGMKELRSETGLTTNAFSKLYGIPSRTVQGWEYGERRTPGYALRLISYAIFEGSIGNE